MVKRTKTMVAVGTLALALAGTGAGVAAAQTTSTPAAPATAPNPAPVNPTPGAKHPGTHTGNRTHTGMGKHRGGLGRVEHGEFTVHTKTGDKVMDVQRGVVTAVNAGSVTVKSTDGFTSTYTLDPTTKVHNGKTTATVAQIATNDRVRLQATKTGSTVTAHHIGDAGPTPAK